MLRNLNSPMEEESLGIAGGWIGGLIALGRHSEFFYPNAIIPIRGNGYPLEFDESEPAFVRAVSLEVAT